MINISAPFSAAFSGPIDARTKVKTIEERNSLPSKYKGLLVYVEDDDMLYTLNDPQLNSWVPVGAGSGSIAMRKGPTHLEWRRTGETLWRPLVSLEELSSGPKGDPGLPLTVRGFVDSQESLPSAVAEINDAYFTLDGDLFVKSPGLTWVYAGNFRGPRGQAGINILGSVSNISEVSEAEVGDAWLVSPDVYVWSGDDWTVLPNLQGPQGEIGPEGPQGLKGDGLQIDGIANSISELNSISAPDGFAYLIGTDLYFRKSGVWNFQGSIKGPKGDGIKFNQVVNSEEELSPGEEDTDIALVGSSVFSWDGSSWNFIEDLKGPKGDGIQIYGTYDSVALAPTDLPLGTNIFVGSKLYFWDGEEWELIADLKGAKGDQGNTLELIVQGDFIRWREQGTSSWSNLIALEDLKGPKGDLGNSIELQTGDNFIQWREQGSEDWLNLIPFDSIKGPKGDTGEGLAVKGIISEYPIDPEIGDAYIWADTTDIHIFNSDGWTVIEGLAGPQGVPGPTGGLKINGIVESPEELPSNPENGDTYIAGSQVFYFNGVSWSQTGQISGPRGDRIFLRRFGSNIQFRYESNTVWENLIPISDLKGDKGDPGMGVQLSNGSGAIYWRYTNPTSAWMWLVGHETIRGPKGDTGNTIQLQSTPTHIQWRSTGTSGTTAWSNLVPLTSITGPVGPVGPQGPIGDSLRIDGIATDVSALPASPTEGTIFVVDTKIYYYNGSAWLESGDIVGPQGITGNSIELRKTETHVQWRETGATTWINLIPLLEIKGNPGDNIELSNNGTHIRWRVSGTDIWSNLISVDTLVGPQGIQGPTGEGLKVIGSLSDISEYPASPEIGDAYVIDMDIHIYTQTGWKIVPGIKGDPGREVEIRRSGSFLQWRYTGSTVWINLLPLEDIKGDKGNNIQLNVSATHIQWRVAGDLNWINLVPLSSLIGPQGPQGLKGDPSPGLSIKGVEESPSLLPLSGNAVGDLWLINGDGWVWTGAEWINAGSIQGPPGTSVNIKGSFASPSNLTSVVNPQEGDGYLVSGDLYVWVGSSWLNVGNIRGPEGPRGLQGIQGATGPVGPGVPSGGNAGDLLVKNTVNPFETRWESKSNFLANSAPLVHTHEISDIVNLQEKLDIITWANTYYNNGTSPDFNITNGAFQTASLSGNIDLTIVGFNENRRSVIIELLLSGTNITFPNNVNFWTPDGSVPDFSIYGKVRLMADSYDNGTTINLTIAAVVNN